MQYNPYTDRARTLEDLAAESKAILIRINNPIQMADIPPQQAAAREQLGRWFSNWMTKNSITQRSINEYGEATGYGPWGSQISALINQDKKIFDPKIQLLVSIAAMNKAIATNVLPKELSSTTKALFLQAEPFLNHEDTAATATDLFALFTGLAEANSKYLNAKELTDSFLAQYCKVLHETFIEVCRDLAISNKEGWGRLMHTGLMAEIKEPEIAELAQDIARGEKVGTAADAIAVLKKYRDCPLYVGLEMMADKPIPKLTDLHNKLLSYSDLWSTPIRVVGMDVAT